jgi:hypothetical protein
MKSTTATTLTEERINATRKVRAFTSTGRRNVKRSQLQLGVWRSAAHCQPHLPHKLRILWTFPVEPSSVQTIVTTNVGGADLSSQGAPLGHVFWVQRLVFGRLGWVNAPPRPLRRQLTLCSNACVRILVRTQRVILLQITCAPRRLSELLLVTCALSSVRCVTILW